MFYGFYCYREVDCAAECSTNISHYLNSLDASMIEFSIFLRFCFDLVLNDMMGNSFLQFILFPSWASAPYSN